MAKFCAMEVAHNTCCKEPHHWLTAHFAFEEVQDEVEEACHVCLVILLQQCALLLELTL